MVKETMTLRAALAQKKMLDKQIDSASMKAFTTTKDNTEKIINGLSVEDWEADAKARWQSLNDKIVRREAIANAILNANAKAYIEVPKFKSFDDINGDEKESLSFAAAIARKNYYKNELTSIMRTITNGVSSVSKMYTKRVKETDRYIVERVNNEFGNTTNASSTQRANREAELNAQYKVDLLDPAEITKKMKNAAEAIDAYLVNIDAALGHMTEITEIEIEY